MRTAGGAFKSMEDFAERVPIKILNKKTIEALAYSGAFNCIGDGKQIAENTEDISTFAKSIQASKVEGQIDMFGELATASLKLKESVVPTFYQKLLWEKKYLGLYVSGHPLQGLSKYIKKKALLVNQITKRDIGKRVHMVGIVANYKKSMTKSGGYMASFTLEDPTGKINAVVFPKVFQKYQHIFVEDALVVMSGKLDNRRGDLQFMCEEAKIVSLDKMIENAKTDNLFVPDEKVLRHVVKLETEETEIEDISLEEPITEPVEVMPYIIEIPEKCLGCLPKIKELLVKNSGDTHVEIHIVGEGEMKKIKVPVTVNIGEEVKEEINKLIVR